MDKDKLENEINTDLLEKWAAEVANYNQYVESIKAPTPDLCISGSNSSNGAIIGSPLIYQDNSGWLHKSYDPASQTTYTTWNDVQQNPYDYKTIELTEMDFDRIQIVSEEGYIYTLKKLNGEVIIKKQLKFDEQNIG